MCSNEIFLALATIVELLLAHSIHAVLITSQVNSFMLPLLSSPHLSDLCTIGYLSIFIRTKSKISIPSDFLPCLTNPAPSNPLQPTLIFSLSVQSNYLFHYLTKKMCFLTACTSLTLYQLSNTFILHKNYYLSLDFSKNVRELSAGLSCIKQPISQLL